MALQTEKHTRLRCTYSPLAGANTMSVCGLGEGVDAGRNSRISKGEKTNVRNLCRIPQHASDSAKDNWFVDLGIPAAPSSRLVAQPAKLSFP